MNKIEQEEHFCVERDEYPLLARDSYLRTAQGYLLLAIYNDAVAVLTSIIV